MTRISVGDTQPAPLSVGIVVPAFDRGGLEQVALNLYRGYRARGCRCIVLVENNKAGFMLSRLADPEHGVVFAGDQSVFLEALSEHEIDVLHYHYSTFGLPEARALGIRTLYTIHNIYTWMEDAAFAHHAARVLEAHRVVAVSGFVRDYFRRRSGCPAERIDLIPNGIDLDWIDGAERGADRLPDLPAGRFVFALPASLHPVKHHLLAIRAAELLAERRRDFQLVLLGNVGEETYAERVEAAIARSRARAQITRVDYLSHGAMSAFYREQVGCVILPSLQEGCANVVLEALAMDRPMILTDVGNAREARRLSPRVRVIPRTEEPAALTPARIAALSASGDVATLRPLVDAMGAVLSIRGAQATADELALRREVIGLDRMVDAYHRLFRTAAPLAAVEPVPAWASRSSTLETFA